MKVCAVVVTYNGATWIEKCLQSIVSVPAINDVKVVDNGSSDSTVKIIEAKFPQVDLIRASQNLGFGQANNIAISKGLSQGADFFFLLNQDAWVIKDAVEHLVKIARTFPSFGILSPVHINPVNGDMDYNFTRYISPEHCKGLLSDLYTGTLSPVYETDFVNAAAWLISRDCIERVGIFDPIFFHYGEDRNYCQRVLYHGLKIGICPAAVVAHDRGGRRGVATSFGGSLERRRFRLVSFCDIRVNDFPKQYIKFLALCALKGLLYAIVCRFSRSGQEFNNFFFFLKELPAIQHSRRDNKRNRGIGPP